MDHARPDGRAEPNPLSIAPALPDNPLVSLGRGARLLSTHVAHVTHDRRDRPAGIARGADRIRGRCIM